MSEADPAEEDVPPHQRPRLPELGNRLRQQMEELGISGAALARRAGINPRQLNHYLNGRRSPDIVTLTKLAIHLRTSLDDLLDPTGYLLHRDDRTYAALQRFYGLCTDLDPPDVAMIADFADVLATRRRQEARAVHFGEIPPVSERLARIHHRLIPVIIQRFAVTSIETGVLHRDDDKLWLVIALSFGQRARRTTISNGLFEMAIQRLGLPEDQVRHGALHPDLVSIEICLGPNSREEAPAKKRRGRRRGPYTRTMVDY